MKIGSFASRWIRVLPLSLGQNGYSESTNFVRLADEARDRRDFALAAKLYKEAIDRGEGSPAIWVQFGHMCKESGDLKGAFEAYFEALKYLPDDADLALQLGHIYKIIGQFDSARTWYEKATRLSSTLTEAATELDAVNALLASQIGNRPEVSFDPQAYRSEPTEISDFDREAVAKLFDVDHYLSGFEKGSAPSDPVLHYLTSGHLEGRDPAPWFSGYHYLVSHPDVAASGMIPFLHYALAGAQEGRKLVPLGRDLSKDVFAAHSSAVSPGPHFEEFDPMIGVGRKKRGKALAFYLPQFHQVDVNDQQWGKGFTEWRQLARALPRYPGHVQPRIPRDLGFYNLADSDAMRRQIELARAAGVHGFCFYHYWFNGQRVLEAPMNRLLADPTLDFPFCLIWANENWTRTWDGLDKEIILEQSYRREDDEAFIDDVARHMKDRRYIRIGERPFFVIYRPGQVPDVKATVARWRGLFKARHGLDPLIFQAQGFDDIDPRKNELDGAIEFPPHKVCQGLPVMNSTVGIFDPNYAGHIFSYNDMVSRSCAETKADFPLIRTVTPTWDNEARRPGTGMTLHGSTPPAFQAWVDRMLSFAEEHPVQGESFVCVNAWNEWAEGAVLEPDVHYGAAYLNALSRALYNVKRPSSDGRLRVVIVGHDAAINGAQMLALNIGQTLTSSFGVEVTYVLGDDGVLLDRYKEVGRVLIARAGSPEADKIFKGLAEQGHQLAITNTTPSGRMVPVLKNAGFRVVSLIHELPSLLKSYGFEIEAKNIASGSDHVIFPSEIVREGFEAFAGKIKHDAELFPQGLYNRSVLEVSRGDNGVRAEFGLKPNCRIVLGVGYADLRKGIDRFVAAGLSLCAAHDDIAFLWAGSPAPEASSWFQPEIDASSLKARVRILGQRTDVARFFAAADVLYLSSREDPFPSVVLEAMAAGIPVVGHAGCGGCDPLIAQHGTLVAQSDMQGASNAILAALKNPSPAAAEKRRTEILKNYDFFDYSFGLLKRLDPDLATVSAVVPNYNYQRFIGERLRSVFDQSYPLRDVIVLDDCSTDDSITEINRVSSAANRKIDLHVNAVNTGSPFRQWKKGVELARGEYVWIAEADDLADPALVSHLISRMKGAGSVLGFTDSRQIDENDERLGDSYKSYMNQVASRAFDAAFDMDGPEFFVRFLSVKNVILNVSGVIFHKQSLLNAFEAIGEELYSFSVAGDWRLYAQICGRKGARVSYLPDALNTHRRHKISVTHALKAEKHLGEIRSMHRYCQNVAMLDSRILQKQAQHLDECAKHLGLTVDS